MIAILLTVAKLGLKGSPQMLVDLPDLQLQSLYHKMAAMQLYSNTKAANLGRLIRLMSTAC